MAVVGGPLYIKAIVAAAAFLGLGLVSHPSLSYCTALSLDRRVCHPSSRRLVCFSPPGTVR